MQMCISEHFGGCKKPSLYDWAFQRCSSFPAAFVLSLPVLSSIDTFSFGSSLTWTHILVSWTALIHICDSLRFLMYIYTLFKSNADVGIGMIGKHLPPYNESTCPGTLSVRPWHPLFDCTSSKDTHLRAISHLRPFR